MSEIDTNPPQAPDAAQPDEVATTHEVASRVGFLVLALLAAAIGASVGLLLVYSTDLPQIGELDKYRPSSITELYDDQGREIGSFALQRRVIVTYSEIPKVLRDALISIEDKDFEGHSGIDLWRAFGAAYRDLRSAGRVQGASTLTMQLSRNLFLSPDKNFGRKLQEVMLAIQIERRFTKQQIFTMYANQVFLGHGVYGFEAGAEFYFSKHAKDLKLEEAALLAGLPKGPSIFSPLRYPERSLHRRNIVINAMLEDGKIRYLETKYGTEEVHEGGLRVYTSLDLDAQKVANTAVLDGLAAYEHRHGWKGELQNVLASGQSISTYENPDWQQPVEAGTYLHGVVLVTVPGRVWVKLGKYTGEITAAEVAWTKAKDPARLLKRGDVVYVRALETPLPQVEGAGNRVRVALEQESGVQGALLAIENTTGDIKALVGGRDFDESKFDRATQALRQVGSSFKPYVYTAAIDQGAKPDDTILDTATTFNTASGAWSPHNYDNRFEGNITLRHALAESRNIPAVKLADKLGMPTVISYVRKFGVTSRLETFLPVALGAAEITLEEQVSAYSTFPNDGMRVTPRSIRKVVDYEGHVLEENYPEVKEVVGVGTARTMTRLLEEVVRNGTARSAGAKLKHALGGKTGTTNDFTDAWFIGFSPSITCGVWVGLDEKKSLGDKEAGGFTALPIWEDFMRFEIAQRPQEDFAGSHGQPSPVVRAQAGAKPAALSAISR
jgi:penicillin-binding protein 1A